MCSSIVPPCRWAASAKPQVAPGGPPLASHGKRNRSCTAQTLVTPAPTHRGRPRGPDGGSAGRARAPPPGFTGDTAGSTPRHGTVRRAQPWGAAPDPQVMVAIYSISCAPAVNRWVGLAHRCARVCLRWNRVGDRRAPGPGASQRDSNAVQPRSTRTQPDPTVMGENACYHGGKRGRQRPCRGACHPAVRRTGAGGNGL